MIGQQLAHFRLIDKIGEGGLGVVYKAHDERLDRDVAIKVLPAESPGGVIKRRAKCEPRSKPSRPAQDLRFFRP